MSQEMDSDFGHFTGRASLNIYGPRETADRIEPALLDDASAYLTAVVAELSAQAATLGHALHPKTASSLADLVRLMNTYYSNLIEGHHTRPRDIERALAGELDPDPKRRDLQLRPGPTSGCRPRSTGSFWTAA